MAEARDISKLFAQLGGSDVGYRELNKDSRASSAEDRWPLLRSVNIAQARTAPPAMQGDTGDAALGRNRHVRAAETPNQALRQAVTRRDSGDAVAAADDGLSGLFARLAAGADQVEVPVGRAPSLWRKKVS